MLFLCNINAIVVAGVYGDGCVPVVGGVCGGLADDDDDQLNLG